MVFSLLLAFPWHLESSVIAKLQLQWTSWTGGKLKSLSYVNDGITSERSVFSKIPTIFWPSLPAEYVIAFSRQTNAPEVRCWLTDTHTQTDRPTDYRNPRCACAPRVNNSPFTFSSRGNQMRKEFAYLFLRLGQLSAQQWLGKRTAPCDTFLLGRIAVSTSCAVSGTIRHPVH